MKQQFDLSLWLKDKSRKVVTRTGEPVEIVLTNWGDPFTILGRIGNSGDPIIWLSDGRSDMGAKLHDNDLFFADEENIEMTEFEKAVQNILNEPHFQDVQAVKQFSKSLLDLVEKELKNNDWRQSLRSYKDAYKQGKQDTEKDLLKLEKSNACIDPTIPVMYTNAASMKTYVEYDGYKLCINDAFEKLSKEE